MLILLWCHDFLSWINSTFQKRMIICSATGYDEHIIWFNTAYCLKFTLSLKIETYQRELACGVHTLSFDCANFEKKSYLTKTPDATVDTTLEIHDTRETQLKRNSLTGACCTSRLEYRVRSMECHWRSDRLFAGPWQEWNLFNLSNVNDVDKLCPSL